MGFRKHSDQLEHIINVMKACRYLTVKQADRVFGAHLWRQYQQLAGIRLVPVLLKETKNHETLHSVIVLTLSRAVLNPTQIQHILGTNQAAIQLGLNLLTLDNRAHKSHGPLKPDATCLDQNGVKALLEYDAGNYTLALAQQKVTIFRKCAEQVVYAAFCELRVLRLNLRLQTHKTPGVTILKLESLIDSDDLLEAEM